MTNSGLTSEIDLDVFNILLITHGCLPASATIHPDIV